MPDIFDRVAGETKDSGSGGDIFSRVSGKMSGDKKSAPVIEMQPKVEGPMITDPKTGERYRQTPIGGGSDPFTKLLDSPVTGARQAWQGIKTLAEPVKAIAHDIGRVPGMGTAPPPTRTDKPAMTSELAKQGAAGVHQVIGGAFEASTPFIAAGGVMAPVRTALTLGAAMASQEATTAGLEALGLPKEYADVAGDLAGLVAGVGVHKAGSKEIPYYGSVGEAIKAMSEDTKAQIRETLVQRKKQKQAQSPATAATTAPAQPAATTAKVDALAPVIEHVARNIKGPSTRAKKTPEESAQDYLARKKAEKEGKPAPAVSAKPADIISAESKPAQPAVEPKKTAPTPSPLDKIEEKKQEAARKAEMPAAPPINKTIQERGSVLPKPAVETPEQELARLKAENAKMKAEESAAPKPAVEKPTAPKVEEKKAVEKKSTGRKIASVPFTEEERGKLKALPLKDLQEQHDALVASGAKGDRVTYYRDLIDAKKKEAATKKPEPPKEQKPAAKTDPLPAPAKAPKPAPKAVDVPEDASPLDKTKAKLQALKDTGDPHWQTGEMVPVEDLMPYREYDRTQEEKRPGHLEGLTKHVAENGIDEPVTLRHDPKTGKTMLAEGNTRLAAAAANGMTHVPVRVVTGEVGEKFPASPGRFEGENPPGDLKPSQIGFKPLDDVVQAETKAPTTETTPPVTETTPALDTKPAPVPEPTAPIHPAVENIKGKSVGVVRIQPVDGSLKPVGEPLEIDTRNDGWESNASAWLEHGGHKGMAMVENLDLKPGVLKKFTVNLAEKPKTETTAQISPSNEGKKSVEAKPIEKKAEPVRPPVRPAVEKKASVTAAPAVEKKVAPARAEVRPAVEKKTKSVFDRMSPSDKAEYDELHAEFMKPTTNAKRMLQIEKKMQAIKRQYIRPGQRGSAPLEFISAGLTRWIENHPKEPIENYKGIGALQQALKKAHAEVKDTFIRNLSRLEGISERAHAAVVQLATSRSQVSVLIGSHVPRIVDALKNGGDHITYDDFRLTLIQNRLIGAQDRWQDLASFVPTLTDKEMEDSFGEWVSGLFKVMQGKKDLPQDLVQTAAALMESKDYGTLRDFAREQFLDAADSVTAVMPEDQFAKNIQDPSFQEALKIYKEMEDKIADIHSLNEGVFSTALGPLDTYYPLTPFEDGEAKIARGPGRGRLAYRRPDNLNNFFTTGLADMYDASPDALRERLSAASRANNKAAAIDVLKQEGLLYEIDPNNETMPQDVFSQHGIPQDIVKKTITQDKIIIRDGKLVRVPGKQIAMPKWLDKEIGEIFEKDTYWDAGVVERAMNAINGYALSGPVDAFYHSVNLVGTLTANTPFLGEDLVSKGLSMPLTKMVASMVKIAKTDINTPEAAQELFEMSRLGLVPERYGTVTMSDKFAHLTGVEPHTWNPTLFGKQVTIPKSFAPLLFGPEGVDIRARLMMYRIAKQANPNATPLEHYKFVNQLGNYTKQLQGGVERAMKSTGLSPFYTAGSTMLRNGINAWLGTGPKPETGSLSHLAWQQLTGGGVVLAATWAVTNKMVNGKWPWEDNESRFMQIQVPEQYRDTWLYKALYGDDPNKKGYVNFLFFNPMVNRGSRGLGIRGAYEAAAGGGSKRQMFAGAVADMTNSVIHPTFGPIPRAAFVGVSGMLGQVKHPYIFPGPGILPGGKANDTGFQNALSVARELNPFVVENPGSRFALKTLDDALSTMDIHTGLGDTHQKEVGNYWLHMVVDTAMPNIIARPFDPDQRWGILEKDEARATAPRVEP